MHARPMHHALFLIVMLATTVVASTARAGTVVASNIPISDGAVYGVGYFGSFAAAQSFTTTAGGTLESVAMRFAANGTVPAAIAIDFYNTGLGGVPTTLLGTGTISSPTLFSTLNWFSADFTSLAIAIASGTTYAIRARPGAVGGMSVGAATSNTYAGGTSWTSSDSGTTWSASPYGYDISFIVTTVPEPGTLALLGIGLLGLAIPRRRAA